MWLFQKQVLNHLIQCNKKYSFLKIFSKNVYALDCTRVQYKEINYNKYYNKNTWRRLG